ncbi:MAG TPA: DUF4367 domain-containing protein [Candidatus Saccharimonadales bacterium]|nr:DUF4367 domain-containing protein [Candidatus Saccharimonadales bacterium]
MSEHVIELNGKRYDASTGAPLGAKGKVIDGFVRPSPVKKVVKTADPTGVLPASQNQKSATKPALKPDVAQAKQHTASSTTRRPEHSKTLMRSSVKRPAARLKPALKTQPPAEVMAKPASKQLARKQSVEQVDSRRMERAIHTPKHNAITRFHHEGSPVLAYTPTAAMQVPVPIIAVREAPAVTPPTTRTHTHASTSHKSADIFEVSMHRATSHTQPAHKLKPKRYRRLINTFAGVAALLVLAGFISYLNMPQLELHVASVQAGFHASLPNYRPTGYALTGGIQRIGGTVSLTFRSGTSGYTITQQASDWNSQTLLDNTLALNGEHETVQRNGQTIYIYGKNDGTNAAWVNGGVRYDLTGNATLSKEDIADIATSL